MWEILLLMDVLNQNMVLVLWQFFTHCEVALSRSYVTGSLAFLRTDCRQIYAMWVVTLRFCHGREFSRSFLNVRFQRLTTDPLHGFEMP